MDILNIIIGVSSLIISIFTFYLVWNYKNQTITMLDKQKFSKDKPQFIKAFNGYYNSLVKDNLYDKSILDGIYVDTNRLNEYVFLSKKTKKLILEINCLIKEKCQNDFIKCTYKNELCIKISKLISLIEKEVFLSWI